MRKKRVHNTGLDELMIVNPGKPGTDRNEYAEDFGGDQYFLGEDGALYLPIGLTDRTHQTGPRAFGADTIFLGEDGTLYVQGCTKIL